MQRVTSYTAAGKEPIGKRREDGGRKNLEGGMEDGEEYRRGMEYGEEYRMRGGIQNSEG